MVTAKQLRARAKFAAMARSRAGKRTKAAAKTTVKAVAKKATAKKATAKGAKSTSIKSVVAYPTKVAKKAPAKAVKRTTRKAT